MLYSQALTGRQASTPSPSATNTTAPRSTTASKPIPGTTQFHTKPRTTTTTDQPNPPSPRRQPPTNPDHKPRTASPEASVYILTLTTTPSLSEPLNALRTAHFPRHLNRTPAHLTLFHALPGSELAAGTITAALEELCGAQRPMRLATGAAFRMRRGVGIGVVDGGKGKGGDGEAEPAGLRAARRLHGALQERWRDVLSEQDRQAGWRPHWTVQNKADSDEAVNAAMQAVQSGFRGAEGLATGCALWRYEKGGRWVFERGFDFKGGI
ncbi:mannose-1-phosphate guanyltransferase [Diaporthe australafricana]|uniref:Mannose-1-phosphate guanyltransferase n=1 Tax=Diaporthe australafricana TaxID=127596 RepID=A0ABR3XP71_9PEZI